MVTLVADILKRLWLCVLENYDHLLVTLISENLIWWEGDLSCFVRLPTVHNGGGGGWDEAKEVNKVTKANKQSR